MKEASYDSIDKKEIERSVNYLGYKLLWILNLFIDGKKFPSGKIRENMWRAYIHDIIEFLKSEQYLKTLLTIDAESVFQIISVIFWPSSGNLNGPYELVQMGREEEPVPKEGPPHWVFMKTLEKYCIKADTPEAIRFQYFYFVAKVVSRSPAFEGYDPKCFFYVSLQLL